MRALTAVAQAAADLHVPLSLVVKSDLGREVLRSVSGVAGLVLQGGGAVHHVFGSPRFSADLDFAQQPELEESALAAALEDAAGVVREAWGSCAMEPAISKGRLHRQKLRVALDPGTSFVLAIERYEVAVHEPETRSAVGVEATVRVESAAEIIADKVVAAVDRFAARGVTKLRDVFDMAFLLDLDLGCPGRGLVMAKLADYSLGPPDPTTLTRLRAMLDEVAVERLRGELQGVLPSSILNTYDPAAAVRKVRCLFQELFE